MNCPRCNVTLIISDKQGIEIDYCQNCRGVWLDKGELEKIIERSNSYDSPYIGENEHLDHHDNHQSYGQGYGHHSKHKKGFFSELFDF